MEEDLEDFAAMMDDYFTRFIKVKKRNHYFSLHLYDLVDILDMRPSMSVWREYVNEDFPEDIESKLFCMIIEYALGVSTEKYGRRLNLFVSDVEHLLFTDTNLSPSSKIGRLLYDIKIYFQELESRLNKITKNILQDLNPFPVIALHAGKNANEYFMTHDIGLYHIEKICTMFKDGMCSCILCLFVLEKRQHYED